MSVILTNKLTARIGHIQAIIVSFCRTVPYKRP